MITLIILSILLFVEVFVVVTSSVCLYKSKTEDQGCASIIVFVLSLILSLFTTSKLITVALALDKIKL